MPPPIRRQAVRLILVAAASAAVVALAFDLINGFPHGLTYDDAYFYAQIAFNLGQSGRSTFDGVSTTSGYHLLWGGLLGAVSALLSPFTSNRILHLFLFEVTFVALAVGVAITFFSGALARFCAIVFAVMGTLLMETLLLSALLLIVARGEVRRPPGQRVARPVLVAAMLVPLARIDATLIAVVYVAVLVLQRERRAAAAFGGVVALGVLAQLGLMLWLFGEPFSVSSVIKATSAVPFGGGLRASVLGPDGVALGYLIRFALFVGLAVAAGLVGAAGWTSVVNRRLLGLSAGAVAFTAGHAVSQMIPFWCYLPAYLVLFYALVEGGRAPDVRTAWLRRAVIAGTAVLGIAFTAHKVYLYTAQIDVARGARRFVDAIPAHVPRDGRIYQIDGSGFTGFFSGRGVVNGDGLVNTYDYARRARANQLQGYLDEQGICYLITNVDAPGDVLVEFGGLRVTRDQVEEQFRSPTYGAFPTTDFVLYRRRAHTCQSGGVRGRG